MSLMSGDTHGSAPTCKRSDPSDTTAVQAGEVQLPPAYLRHTLHTRCGHTEITHTEHDQTQVDILVKTCTITSF